MSFNCFVCDKENPKGLKLDIKLKDGFTYAEFSLDKNYEGYPGIIHGGIIAAILDDMMVNVKFLEGYILYTVELNVKYLKHCLINEKLFAYGYPKETKHNIFQAYGEIKDKNGEIKATGLGKYFIKEAYK
ncbi:hotdog domain-containing protein [Caldisericum sp. AR60]|uniref:hotdog domain-containing protein n=1 Tax=Caldisericum sp. AR60 TaxID=3397852 RepID=UPI0039FC79EB